MSGSRDLWRINQIVVKTPRQPRSFKLPITFRPTINFYVFLNRWLPLALRLFAFLIAARGISAGISIHV